MKVLNVFRIVDIEPIESISVTNDLILLASKNCYSIYKIEFHPNFSLKNVKSFIRTNQSLGGDIIIKPSTVSYSMR